MLMKTSGLTLIELTLIIAILSLCAILAAPSFSGLINKTKSNLLATELIQFLYASRAMATQAGKPVIICGSIDFNSCMSSKFWSGAGVMAFIDHNNDQQFTPLTDEPFRVVDLPTGSFLAFRAFKNKNYLRWLPGGTTDTQNGNFTYCPVSGKAEDGNHIIMNVAGIIRKARDSNQDGIVETTQRKNIQCL